MSGPCDGAEVYTADRQSATSKEVWQSCPADKLRRSLLDCGRIFELAVADQSALASIAVLEMSGPLAIVLKESAAY